MKRLNRAFTLTELLVALGVVAILCSVLLPVIFNMMPNQNTIMAKRAYYTVQTVVADLINDEGCYPDKTSSDPYAKRIGFDDAEGSPNCAEWSTVGIDSTSEKATEKFIKLFGKKVNVDDATVSTKFSTGDSMVWYFDGNGFNSHTEADKGGSIKLIVDVNGTSGPNCARANAYTGKFGTDGSDCLTRESGFDRFQMIIYGNGKVEISSNDVWAKNAVKVDRNITGSGTSNSTDN